MLASNLDKVLAQKEVKKMERLDATMLDVARSPFTPFWALKEDKSLSPLCAIKVLKHRYGNQDDSEVGGSSTSTFSFSN